ncbi:MAG: hypothetical protein ACD_74C00079G0002 [uncultured bacterium]|nr:MAG: hypothetical protein ACD_74C00079G0002 [uncultured bacterium]
MLKKLKTALKDYEVLMLVVMSIFAVAFMINVKDNPRAGRLFPTYIGLATLCLIAVESVILFRKKRKAPLEAKDTLPDQERREDIGQHRPGLVPKFVALIFLYYLAILLMGYLYATFLFLVLIMWFLGIKSKVEILLISVGTLAVIYVVFILGFQFILPSGELF